MLLAECASEDHVFFRRVFAALPASVAMLLLSEELQHHSLLHSWLTAFIDFASYMSVVFTGCLSVMLLVMLLTKRESIVGAVIGLCAYVPITTLLNGSFFARWLHDPHAQSERLASAGLLLVAALAIRYLRRPVPPTPFV